MFKKYQKPDCSKFECGDACCTYGVDVWPHEVEKLVAAGLATRADFTGPERDEEGDLLYRTELGPRGCIFLNPDRGCRIHFSGLKPDTCIKMPSSDADIEIMLENEIMPCCEPRPE